MEQSLEGGVVVQEGQWGVGGCVVLMVVMVVMGCVWANVQIFFLLGAIVV